MYTYIHVDSKEMDYLVSSVIEIPCLKAYAWCGVIIHLEQFVYMVATCCSFSLTRSLQNIAVFNQM